MPDTQTAREALRHLLFDVRDVEESVIRGEKRLGDQTYAVAYVDFADEVVERSDDIRAFQERILGDDFFESTGDLRWNKYLYIVAGPKSTANPGFAAAKARIEADKDYARKRVIAESDLESLLGGAKLFDAAQASQAYDVLSDWERRLASVHLDLLLDCPTPRTAVIERIASGTAVRAATQPRMRELTPSDQYLATSKLSALTVTSFRPIHNGKTYQFGDVNLIVGANGTGKTSLLEAIEYLYCGRNRRHNSAVDIRLNAKLNKSSDGSQYSLASTTDGPRLKARCLAWYNRDERSLDTITSSFSLYNFLDTDAAFRLSGSLNSGDVTDELSKLLVGPAASTTYDYLQKIYVDIEKSGARAERQIALLQQELSSAEKRLRFLQDSPSNAKSLTEAYRTALAALGWRRVSLDSPPHPSEGNALLKALGHVQTLQAAGTSAQTISDISARARALSAAVDAATPLDDELLKLSQREEVLADQVSAHDSRVEELDRWLAISNSGFHEVLRNFPRVRKASQQLIERLGSLVAGELPAVPSPYDAEPLKIALSNAVHSREHAEKLLADTRELINQHGKVAAARADVAARLKAAALEATRHTHDHNACPVCRTVHPEGALLQLIEELTFADDSSPELNRLTEAMRLTEAELSRVHGAIAVLQFAHAAASTVALSAELRAPEILEQIAELRKQSQQADDALQQITKQGKSLNESGFSKNENDILWGRIRGQFSESEEWPSTDAVTKARDTHLRDSDSKRKDLEICRTAKENLRQSVLRICETISLNGWNTQVQSISTHESLVALRDEFSSIAAHVPNLLEYLDVNENATLTDSQVGISSVVTSLNQALAAHQAESISTGELRDLSQKISADKEKLKVQENEFQALQNAVRTLKTLFEEASLGIATADAMTAIKEQINEVFSRIHSPREYEYVGGSEKLLQAVATPERRSLDEVSTGQRAAFALSIFLARHRTATSAPPILLIDDPIAHIDDLNALSFLDYLRDLAVSSGRQIFFATADSRVASLFAKKFSFLGGRFQTISLSRAHI